jgi:hypothetical protein
MNPLTPRFMRSGALASGLLCLAGISACGGGGGGDTPARQSDPVVAAQPVTAASIGTQPKTQVVAAGQAATFSVQASGSGTLAYQWWRNGVALAGATGASYTTAPATLADSGDVFSVVVRNEGASVASNAVALQVDGVGARVLAGGAIEPTRAQVDGVGKQANFLSAARMDADSAGNLLLVDMSMKTVRKITPGGVVSSVAVGANTTPALNVLRDIAAGPNGLLYVIDSNSASLSLYLRKIGPDGVVGNIELGNTPGDPVAGDGSALAPVVTAVATDGAGNLYVASDVTRMGAPECSSCTKRVIVRKLAPDGKVSILVENVGSHASQTSITDLAVDGAGNLFMVDGLAIRKRDPKGVITTLLGDDQAFIQAIAVDAGGNLYFATEPFSGRQSPWPIHAIGKIAPDRTITVAADPNGSDARFKSAAWITSPAGLALDAAGALYVSGNGRVLKLVLP